MLLAGDIGGTKTLLAIYTDNQQLSTPIAEASFPSAEYDSLEAIVEQFLAKQNYQIERACFGVAGPVIEGRANITNLPWRMDEQEMQRHLRIPVVRLLNDLASIATALPILQSTDLLTLNSGQTHATGSIAVIAPGTGLGEAFLTWDGQRYRAYSSEGGHTDYAPTNEWENELLHFMRTDLGYAHVSYESVCSGLGIPHLYAFVRKTQVVEEPGWFARELELSKNPTPLIINAALDQNRPCPSAVKTLETFAAILGAEAGNLALKVMATGGVYLAGGIPPRILSFLRSERFLQAFCNKGRFATLLAQMPVHVVLHPKAGLLGAAAHQG
ncbi:MAG: glucokinase [Caldilineaceae bacterium]